MNKKKILVADDSGHWAGQWPRLLDVRRPDQYLVEVTASPEVAANLLDNDPEIWLAVIDMDFGKASHHTGLHALLAAERNARRRAKGQLPLHTIITTTDEEDNRVLFKHAAFQCFDPAPVDLLHKDNGFDTAVLDALEHLSRGGRPGSGRYARFAPKPGKETLMHQLLVGRPRKKGAPSLNLALWKALADVTEEDRDDATRGIQRLQHQTGLTGRQSIYPHLDAAREVAALVACDMRFPPQALLNDKPKKQRSGDVLGTLSQFAGLHALFFQAPELPDLIKRMEQGHTRR